MAFTYTLTDAAVTGTDPAGTDFISLGDDNIRNFKSAVIERVNSAFADVNAQPWVLKSPVAGGNVQSVVPASDNLYTLGTAALRWASIYGTISTATQTNITSLGLLTGLAINGVLYVDSFALATAGSLGARIATISNIASVIVLQTYNYAGAAYFPFRGDSLSYAWQLSGVNSLTLAASGLLTAVGGFSGNLTGTVLTAAQGSITSLGTLTGLTVGASIVLQGTNQTVNPQYIQLTNTGGTYYAGIDNSTGTAFAFGSGTAYDFVIYTPHGADIRINKTTGVVSASAGVTANLTGNVTGNVSGNLTGTVLTAAQANITSIGTLTGLTVSGAVTFQTGLTITKNNGAGAVGTAYQFTINSGVSGSRAEFHFTDNVTSDAFISFLPSATAANAILTIYSAGGSITLAGNGAVVFNGALSGISTLTATTVNANLNGNVTGTILTAAQTNITSLGTLASLTVTGLVTVGSLSGLTAMTLGNPGVQCTLTANAGGNGSPVATAAQARWLPITGSDSLVYYVPAWR